MDANRVEFAEGIKQVLEPAIREQRWLLLFSLGMIQEKMSSSEVKVCNDILIDDELNLPRELPGDAKHLSIGKCCSKGRRRFSLRYRMD